MAYVLPDYVLTDYVVDDVVVGPPVLATLTFAGPGVGGATPVGTTTILAIPTAPRLYPDIIFALHTLAGLRLFGERMIPDEIACTDLGRYSSMLDISDLNFRSVPLGNDLVDSLGSSEQLTGWAVFDNTDKFWSRLVMREPLLCAAAGIFQYYGGSHLYMVYRGEVTRVLIRKNICRLEFSEP